MTGGKALHPYVYGITPTGPTRSCPGSLPPGRVSVAASELGFGLHPQPTRFKEQPVEECRFLKVLRLPRPQSLRSRGADALFGNNKNGTPDKRDQRVQLDFSWPPANVFVSPTAVQSFKTTHGIE